MSNPATFSASPNATFSLVSEVGALPCAKPDGATAAPSGVEAARVSRFRAQDANKAMPTNDTSGPLFSASSPSASLQRFLENKLRARMGANGSPEYALIWKHWDMPAGLPICALRASARRTSGSGFTGWPTPNATDSTGPGTQGRQGGMNLQTAVGWATPRARDAKNNGVSIARAQQGVADSLDLQCKLVSQNGMVPQSPLTDRTDRRALPLNPRFSLWLQGYPAMWADCAAPVTRLSRK